MSRCLNLAPTGTSPTPGWSGWGGQWFPERQTPPSSADTGRYRAYQAERHPALESFTVQYDPLSLRPGPWPPYCGPWIQPRHGVRPAVRARWRGWRRSSLSATRNTPLTSGIRTAVARPSTTARSEPGKAAARASQPSRRRWSDWRRPLRARARAEACVATQGPGPGRGSCRSGPDAVIWLSADDPKPAP